MNYIKIMWFCWGAFFLVWAGGAIYNFIKGPEILKKKTKTWWSWLISIMIVWLLARYVRYVPRHFWSALHWNVPGLQITGVILLMMSTFFTLWSRVVLGVMWSSTVTLKLNHRLRTDGPYQITRHPIYTGMLGMFVGSTLISIIFLPILLLALAIFSIKISTEEELMIEQFGEQYLEYKRRVPQLIPGLRLKWRH